MMVNADLLLLAIMAFCTAALSRFIDFCMESGNILNFWYRFVIEISKAKFDIHGNLLSDNGLYKPLGGCILCFNFWVGVLPFIWAVYLMDYNFWEFTLLFFGYQGLSSYFLQLQEKSIR